MEKNENFLRYKSNKGEIWRNEKKICYTFSENIEKAGKIWKALTEMKTA